MMNFANLNDPNVISANRKLFNLSVITSDIIRRVFNQKEIDYLFFKFKPETHTIESLCSEIIQHMRDPNMIFNPVSCPQVIIKNDPAFLPPPRSIINDIPALIIHDPVESENSQKEESNSFDDLTEDEKIETRNFQSNLVKQTSLITDRLKNMTVRIETLQKRVVSISDRLDIIERA